MAEFFVMFYQTNTIKKELENIIICETDKEKTKIDELANKYMKNW